MTHCSGQDTTRLIIYRLDLEKIGCEDVGRVYVGWDGVLW
jgi:hypothetical protein